MVNNYKKELRKHDFEGRKQEVALYEVNIENFEKAVELAKSRGLDEFASELTARLKTEREQLARAKVIYDVVEGFLNE